MDFKPCSPHKPVLGCPPSIQIYMGGKHNLEPDLDLLGFFFSQVKYGINVNYILCQADFIQLLLSLMAPFIIATTCSFVIIFTKMKFHFMQPELEN